HRVKDGHTQLLLQKRSAHKDSNPGCYDISSAGHIDAGDEPLPSAIRELSEELGIQAGPDDFRFIGLCPNYSEKAFYGHPFRDNELSYVYLVEKEADIADMTLEPSEVESVMWMDIDEIIRRQCDGSLKNCLHDVELQMVRNALDRRHSHAQYK
ncbi:MAG: NUDIX domain-containing protein, partial [Lachnospiraceae bacterium]|nr:NUDIX domain-containing protein [Lachnospiraceae bacterium]